MLIEYKNVNTKSFKTDTINVDITEYEISEEDMFNISSIMNESYQVRRFLLTNDHECFKMLVDNIESGYIIQGGLKDGKMLLNQYIVKEGLNEFILMLNQNF